MMRFLICVCTFLTVLELSAAYWIDANYRYAHPTSIVAEEYNIITAYSYNSSQVRRNVILHQPQLERTTYTDAYEDYPSEESALNVFSEVKRDTCAQWGRICVPSSKYKFVQCCSGLVCSCNIWKTTCKCRAKLG